MRHSISFLRFLPCVSFYGLFNPGECHWRGSGLVCGSVSGDGMGGDLSRVSLVKEPAGSFFFRHRRGSWLNSRNAVLVSFCCRIEHVLSARLSENIVIEICNMLRWRRCLLVHLFANGQNKTKKHIEKAALK